LTIPVGSRSYFPRNLPYEDGQRCLFPVVRRVLLQPRVVVLINTLATLSIYWTAGTSHRGGIAQRCSVRESRIIAHCPRRPPNKNATGGPLFELVVLAFVWLPIAVKRPAILWVACHFLTNDLSGMSCIRLQLLESSLSFLLPSSFPSPPASPGIQHWNSHSFPTDKVLNTVMPSSITLTVSHLPTSTSFFLSALQPLEYSYRGRTGQTIGFGSAVDRKAPADFWITQEVPGVPAGAAHVAFAAPSRAAVQDFFVAALKAGGKIHGEPCVRDASGYYSAAVIDFDGNSIEAVHRPSYSDDKENDGKSVVSGMSSVRTSSNLARSTVSRAPSVRSVAPPPQAQSGNVFDNLFAEARNAADVARNLVDQARQHQPQLMPNNVSDSSGAVAGTLLGVAAGAALLFALSNNNNQSHPPELARSVTDPPPRSEYSTHSQSRQPCAIDAPPSSFHPRMITMHDNDNSSDCGSTIRPRRSSSITGDSTASRRTSTRMIEAAPPTSYKAPSVLTTTSSRHEDRARSRASSASRHSRSRSQSTSDRTIVRVTETVTSAARYPLPESTISKATSKRSSRGPSPSRYPLPESTISKATSKRSSRGPSPSRYPLPASTTSKASTVRTAFRDREPEAYPLPLSRAGTWAGSSTSKRESRSGRSHTTSDNRSVISNVPKGELTPDDSVSQISVGGSERSRRSRR
jgi:hypothetical protein